MRIETAREIKAHLWRDTVVPQLEHPAPGDAVAVGVCATADGYGLAVRYAGLSPMAQAVVTRARALADGDCDIREIGAVHALQWDPGELQQRVRPLRPGLSVAHAGVTAGTIGAFVVPTDEDGPAHVLSNNHVLADSDQATPGELALQPGPADGGQSPADRIGVLDRVVEMRRDAANLVDAATAELMDRFRALGSVEVPRDPVFTAASLDDSSASSESRQSPRTFSAIARSRSSAESR
jgi:hypothetical protein